MKTLSSGDWIVFLVYFVIVSLYGYWVYKSKNKHDESTSKGYFLAEGSLTWWAIGASLIASNISAEQMVGMSGSGFKMGLAISTYEWMAAATLVIVAVFFIPVYLKNKIATMPQFLHQRYNGSVALIMSILYLGGVAIAGISGLDLKLVIGLLAIFSIVITLGGMKVIGYTDVIQVFFLILGGLAATYIALNLISEKAGTTGLWNGFKLLRVNASDHFHMIFN